MMLRLLAVVLLVSFGTVVSAEQRGAARGTGAQRPAAFVGQPPAHLGAGLLDLGSNRVDSLNLRMSKVPKGWFDPHADAFLLALNSATGQSNPRDQTLLALALFVPVIEGVWPRDEFSEQALKDLIQRVSTLPSEFVGVWARQLGSLEGTGPASAEQIRLEAAAYLGQVSRLFRQRAFDAKEGELLLQRLKSVDGPTAKAVMNGLQERSKRLKGKTDFVSQRQAAMLLIQQDAMFAADGALRRDPFTNALGALAK